jgi:hypothetical protein
MLSAPSSTQIARQALQYAMVCVIVRGICEENGAVSVHALDPVLPDLDRPPYYSLGISSASAATSRLQLPSHRRRNPT